MHSDLVESNAQTEKTFIEDSELDVRNVCGEQIDIFESEDDMRKSLARLCYGDLYVVGRIWIETLRTMLLGTKLTLIPVVSAAAKPEIPQRPPPMKYTDLPLYKSPHYEYKDFIEDKKKCPKAKVKILHECLLPKVKVFRRDFAKRFCDIKCGVFNTYHSLATSMCNGQKDLKKKMRDPKNLPLRQGLVLAGGAAGFLLGAGRGIPRRLIFTSIGLLSTGALCFPKETDAAFREFTYYSGKMVLAFYNGFCRKNLNLRERIPCKDQIPPPPPPRPPLCPPKK